MKTLFKFFPTMALAAIILTGCSDECDDVNCRNGGTCDDGVCACPAGYIGDECETEDRAKYLGSYSVSESCQSGNYSYQMTITTSGAGIQNIVMGFEGYSLSATVNSSNITIANQTVNIQGNAITFSGSGQLVGNILTVNYTFSAGTESDNCTATATKL